jgi:ComF family protein
MQKCPVCEKQSIGGRTHPGCLGRYTLDGLFSIFEYKKLIRRAITQLKFRGLRDIKKELSCVVNVALRKLYEENVLIELEDFIFREFPVFVPIPLHWLRKGKRKFNQAEFITDIFAKEYKRPVFLNLLIRTKNTEQQTKLKGKERKDNVKGVFKVRNIYLTKKIRDEYYRIDKNLKNIVLIDDVATTGATLKSAANTLKRSGAKKVWAITLAS